MNLDETMLGYIYFCREPLDCRAIDPTSAGVIKVRGKSLEPTPPDRLLDPDKTASARVPLRRIYVVRTDEGMVVKPARRDSSPWVLSRVRWRRRLDWPGPSKAGAKDD